MLTRWIIALTVAGTFYTGGLLALGLGKVTLLSSLNQPLKATIELLDADHLKQDEIVPYLGSKKDFKRVGISRPDYLNQLLFNIIEKDGNFEIKISTKDPFNEPFINFLLEVKWSKGRLLREYTVLLDPPSFDTRHIVTKSKKELAGNLPDSKPEFASVNTNSPESYIVKNNDSLWNIARKFIPDEDFTVEQMMTALEKMNPDAFMEGDTNRLKKSALLTIPTEEDILSITELPRENKSQLKLKRLTKYNLELVNQLQILEDKLSSLESMLKKPVKITPVIQESKRKEIAPVSKPIVVKKIEQSIEPEKNITSVPSVVDHVPVTQSVTPLSVTEENSPKKIIQPFSDNKPAINSANKINDKDLFSMLRDNLYTFGLGAGGLFLLVLLGLVILKRRREVKEEQEMDKILAEEAGDEQNVESDSVDKKTERSIEKDAIVFSEKVTASKEPENKKVNDTKIDVVQKTVEKEKSDNNTEESLIAVETDSDLSGAEESLSLNMNDSILLSKEDNQKKIEESNDNLEARSSETNSPKVEVEEVALNEELSSEELSSEELSSEELSSEEQTDKDFSKQLEDLNQEISSLTDSFSFEDGEKEKEKEKAPDSDNENNDSISSLLDLARAYIEMGDKAEAREILNNALQKANNNQEPEIKKLLDSVEQ